MLQVSSIIFSIILGLSFQVLANSEPKIPAKGKVPLSFPKGFTKDYNFEGIVGLYNCSGSYVRFEHSRDSDYGMVLTNGHCYSGGFLHYGQVITNKKSDMEFSVLDANAGKLGKVFASEIIYGTMTKTDVLLYRLKETYQEIKAKFGVEPLTMSSKKPLLSDKIEIISGYWERGFTCAIEKFVEKLKESEWIMEDSMRYSRPGCETFGGTSGSPVILAGTRTVIGINNTGNDSGKNCTMNNPCEVDSDGTITAVKGYSYGQQTFWIYSCLDTKGQLDLNTVGCLLPK